MVEEPRRVDKCRRKNTASCFEFGSSPIKTWNLPESQSVNGMQRLDEFTDDEDDAWDSVSNMRPVVKSRSSIHKGN